MPDDDTTPPEDSQDASPEGEGSVEEAIDEAQSTVDDTQATVDEATGETSDEPDAFAMPEFSEGESQIDPASIDLLADVNLNVKIELGRTRLLVEDVLKLGEGAVIELDKLAGDPVDIYVNDRHVARGEVLVLNDNFCVRVSEILDTLGDAAHEASGAA